MGTHEFYLEAIEFQEISLHQRLSKKMRKNKIASIKFIQNTNGNYIFHCIQFLEHIM